MIQPNANQEPKPNPAAPGDSSVTEQPEVVERSAYEQVKADMHKYKARAKEVEDQLAAKETSKLKDDQKWKELAEVNEREALEAKEKLKKLNSTVIEDRKLSVIRTEAQKLGILPSALDDLDNQSWSDVSVEFTSTGRINVIGAAKAVERFKTLKPHWFQGAQAPGVNTTTPNVVQSAPAGAVTLKDIAAAEAEAKKTGDTTAYKALVVKFQQQKK